MGQCQNNDILQSLGDQITLKRSYSYSQTSILSCGQDVPLVGVPTYSSTSLLKMNPKLLSAITLRQVTQDARYKLAGQKITTYGLLGSPLDGGARIMTGIASHEPGHKFTPLYSSQNTLKRSESRKLVMQRGDGCSDQKSIKANNLIFRKRRNTMSINVSRSGVGTSRSRVSIKSKNAAFQTDLEMLADSSSVYERGVFIPDRLKSYGPENSRTRRGYGDFSAGQLSPK